MKVFFLYCVMALTALTSARDYKRIENFDFKAFLADDNGSNYDYRASMDCFLDKIPCQDVEMKETLLEILKTRCAHCSTSMLQKYNWVLTTLKEDHPEDYKAIMYKIFNKV